MSGKAASIVSVVLTILVLIVIGIVVFLMDVIALNGFNGREGGTALTALTLCGGIGIILSAIAAGKLTRFLTAKYNWHILLSTLGATLVSVALGSVIFGIAFVVSLIIAEAMFYS